MTFDVSPAPGRTPILLERGWTAVLLEPLPGAGVQAVGLFCQGELEEVIDTPAEVRRLVETLARPSAERRTPQRLTERP